MLGCLSILDEVGSKLGAEYKGLNKTRRCIDENYF